MAVIGALRGVLSLDSAAFEKGAKRAQASMNDLQRRLAKSGAAMKSVGNKMSLYVTAPLSGVAAASLAAARSVGELDNSARVAGVSVQRFKELSIATKSLGVEQDKLSDILKDVNDKFGDYFQTGAGPLVDFFENIAPKVGLTKEAFEGLSSDQALQKYVDALEEANVSQADMTFYLEALASDATLLLPAFAQGGRAISDVAERARELGLVLDEDMIGRSREAAAEMSLVSEVLKSKFQVALASLAPVITSVIEELSPVLEGISQRLQDFTEWFDELSPSTQKFIGVSTALAAALGPVLIGLGFVATGLATLASPIGLVIFGFGALAASAAYVVTQWDDMVDRFPWLERLANVGAELKDKWGDLPSIKWALLIPTLKWASFIPGLRWAAYIPKISWAVLGGALKWTTLVARLSWAGLGVIPVIGWAALAGSLAWSLLVKKIEWDGWIPKIVWADWIPELNWGEFLNPKDYGQSTYEAGKALAEDAALGLSDGLSRSFPTLEAETRGYMEGLESAARDAVDSNSPSKDFMRIGEDMMDGLGIGIAENAQSAATIAADAARKITESAANEVLGLQRVFDGVLDGTITSWEDALDSMWDTFKSWLSNMIFTGANNPIQIGASFTGSGGAGVTQSLSGLSSGFGSFFGEWGGTGLLGGASGLIENTLANGFSGFTGYIESALAGATGSLAGFGTALGAIALPLAGVGLLISGFQSKTEVLSESMKISAEGLDATLEQITKTETSRFWGLSKSTSTDTEDIGGSEFDDAVRAIQDSVLDLASTFNIGAEALAGFTYSSKWDVGDLSQDEALAKIEEELGYYGDALSAAVLDWGLAAEGLAMTWQDIADEGQTATDVLEDLNLSLAGVNAMFEYMQQAAYGASLSGALAADELVDLFGSLDDMSAALTSYMNLFYSEAERFEFAILDIERALSDLGFEMPATLDGFRDLVEAQDLATEAGRETYAALIILAETFYDVMEAAGTFSDELVDAFGDLGDSINTLLADAAADQDEAQAAADAWRDTADSLRDFVADLTGEYSPEAALEAAAASYSDTLLKALAGDQDAAKEFPDIAGDYLDAAAGQVSSGAEYEHLVKRTQQDALRLADAADEQASLEETMVDLYQEQIDILEQLAVFLDYANSLSSDEIAALGGMETVLGAIDAGVAGYQVGLDAIALALANPLSVDFASLESTITAALEPATLFGDFETTLAKALAPSTDALTGSIDYLREMIEAEIRLLGEIENIDVSDLIPDAAPPDYTAMIADLNAQLASLSFGDVAGLTAAYNAQVAADKLLTDNAGDYTRSADAQAIWDQVVAAREAEQTAEDLRNQIVALGGVPLYSSGTDFHPGGLAMVHGPELINLPRGSNVTSVSDTKGLFAGLAAELGAVHREIAALRSEQRQLGIQTANNTRKTSRTLEKFDKDGLPAERTT